MLLRPPPSASRVAAARCALLLVSAAIALVALLEPGAKELPELTQTHPHIRVETAAPRRLRVALLFFGQLRNPAGLAPQQMHICLLDGRYEVDIFAHFWFDPGLSVFEASRYANSPPVLPNAPALFREAYGEPVAILMEPPIPVAQLTKRNYNHSHGHESRGPVEGQRMVGNMLSMYLSMQRVFELFQRVEREEGLAPYDFVVSARTDSVFVSCPSLGSLDKSFIYAADRFPERAAYFCDHALLMPRDTATAVLTVSHRFDTQYDDGVFAASEPMMYANIERAGLLPRLRLLPLSVLNVPLTRDGETVGHAGENLASRDFLGVVSPQKHSRGYDMRQPSRSYKEDPDFAPDWPGLRGS